MAGEKEKIVPTVWDRFNKLESQIADLKENMKLALENDDEQDDVLETHETILRDYFKYRKDWSELIMKKSPYGSPLDTWMMISLHKFMKDALETLDIPKQTEKKEIPSENLRTCSECQKIFESIKLRKNHEFLIHGIGEFIKDSEGEKEVGEATTHKHEEGTRRPDSRPNSKPSESEKEFEFQLVEKFIPPRNIKCSDCMNNPIPELIEAFLKDYRVKKEEIKDYVRRSFYDCEESDALLQDNLFKDLEDKWEAMQKK